MLETMYQLPSLSEVHACQITEDTVLGKSPPELINNTSEVRKTA
jgi:ATP-dependent protease Clp ATPase subunit